MKTPLPLMLTTSLLATGCGDKASFDVVEQNRAIAKDNAAFVAASWRNANDKTAKVQVIGDSTIAADCPQGDGWSTVFVYGTDGEKKDELKCSTYSVSVGCIRKADFQDRQSYYEQEGVCHPDLPVPIPRIVR